MSGHAFDAYARRAAFARDRRSVLGLVAGAVLAVSSAPFAADAGSKKKRRKGCKKNSKECRALSNQYCTGQYDSPDTEACIADIHVCCGLLARCKYKQANACNRAIPW